MITSANLLIDFKTNKQAKINEIGFVSFSLSLYSPSLDQSEDGLKTTKTDEK